jgi:carbamoyltransferase
MHILGISAFYHDSAAALLRDGDIVAAAQEERFTRKKHDAGFPDNALEICLTKGRHQARQDVDHVAFYDKPFLKFERLLETYVAYAPRGFKSFRMAIPLWLKEKLFLKDLLTDLKELRRMPRTSTGHSRLLFSEHHLSHAASAFFPSPFEEAAVLTMDGVGEWATTSLAIGRGNKLDILKEIHFPHSLGLLYSAFTYYTGFKVNSGEYKLMGLAPYGEPKLRRGFSNTSSTSSPTARSGSNQAYFDYCTGLTHDQRQVSHELFGGPPPRPRRAHQRTWTWRRRSSSCTEESCCAGAVHAPRPACATCAWPAAWR